MLAEITTDKFIERFADYDLIIDARSPSEYAHSHVKNAVNYFALNDEEHKEIGTIYKQISPFEARSKGAAYVCKNAISHIQTLFATLSPSAKIAIYCAKGGMRSSSLSAIFSSIGYRVERVVGGYKSYRAHILPCIESFEQCNFITLMGHTGCGKSELLSSLENVIDLEGMAEHFGSVFGAVNGSQPSQKEFQNRLFHAFLEIDRQKPIFIEAESKKIGQVCMPPELHDRMIQGYRVEITAPLEQRVSRIRSMYQRIDEQFFMSCMDRITPYIAHNYKDAAIEDYNHDKLDDVAEILLVHYYDIVYKKNSKPDLVIHNDNIDKSLEILRELQNSQRF